MECVLFDRQCSNCGECEICDLNPSKICDNCCECIEAKTDFAELRVDAVVDAETYLQEGLDLDEAELLDDEDFPGGEEARNARGERK